jgi:hypothetical protein
MLSFRFVAIRTPRGVESTLQGTDAEHVLVEPKFKSRVSSRVMTGVASPNGPAMLAGRGLLQAQLFGALAVRRGRRRLWGRGTVTAEGKAVGVFVRFGVLQQCARPGGDDDASLY